MPLGRCLSMDRGKAPAAASLSGARFRASCFQPADRAREHDIPAESGYRRGICGSRATPGATHCAGRCPRLRRPRDPAPDCSGHEGQRLHERPGSQLEGRLGERPFQARLGGSRGRFGVPFFQSQMRMILIQPRRFYTISRRLSSRADERSYAISMPGLFVQLILSMGSGLSIGKNNWTTGTVPCYNKNSTTLVRRNFARTPLGRFYASGGVLSIAFLEFFGITLCEKNP